MELNRIAQQCQLLAGWPVGRLQPDVYIILVQVEIAINSAA